MGQCSRLLSDKWMDTCSVQTTKTALKQWVLSYSVQTQADLFQHVSFVHRKCINHGLCCITCEILSKCKGKQACFSLPTPPHADLSFSWGRSPGCCRCPWCCPTPACPMSSAGWGPGSVSPPLFGTHPCNTTTVSACVKSYVSNPFFMPSQPGQLYQGKTHSIRTQ